MQRKPIRKLMAVEKICEMITKGRVSFENPNQRSADQWNKENKSLLIDSLLRPYVIIPDIIALHCMDKNNNYNRVFDIIEGKQRLTTIASYIANEWALTKLKPINIAGEVHDISGKKFIELPECIKEEIKECELSFIIIELEDKHDENDIVEDIFYRLNNGKICSKEHLALVKAGANIKDFARRMVDNHKLFTNIAHFTSSNCKNSIREMTIMQSIILLSDLNYKTFRNKDVQLFFEENEISEDVLILTEKAFAEIVKIFPEFNDKISKTNIPILTYIISKLSDENKDEAYRLIKKYFSNDARKGDKYSSFCGKSNAQKNFIKGRIATLQEICNIQISQAAK